MKSEFITVTVSQFLEVIINGYGMYSILYVCLFFLHRDSGFNKRLDDEANKLVILTGLLYSLFFLFRMAVTIFSATVEDKEFIYGRVFGEYWFGYWLQPFIYLTATQLLRFQKVRANKAYRLIIGLFVLISIERLTILLVDAHRDYVRLSSNPWSDVLVLALFEWFIFDVITAIYWVIKVAIRKAVNMIMKKQSQVTDQTKQS